MSHDRESDSRWLHRGQQCIMVNGRTWTILLSGLFHWKIISRIEGRNCQFLPRIIIRSPHDDHHRLSTAVMMMMSHGKVHELINLWFVSHLERDWKSWDTQRFTISPQSRDHHHTIAWIADVNYLLMRVPWLVVSGYRMKFSGSGGSCEMTFLRHEWHSLLWQKSSSLPGMPGYGSYISLSFAVFLLLAAMLMQLKEKEMILEWIRIYIHER